MEHTKNPCTQRAEAGASPIWGQPIIGSETCLRIFFFKKEYNLTAGCLSSTESPGLPTQQCKK